MTPTPFLTCPACGTTAVAWCTDCHRPICLEHSEVRDGVRRCRECASTGPVVAHSPAGLREAAAVRARARREWAEQMPRAFLLAARAQGLPAQLWLPLRPDAARSRSRWARHLGLWQVGTCERAAPGSAVHPVPRVAVYLGRDGRLYADAEPVVRRRRLHPPQPIACVEPTDPASCAMTPDDLALALLGIGRQAGIPLPEPPRSA